MGRIKKRVLEAIIGLAGVAVVFALVFLFTRPAVPPAPPGEEALVPVSARPTRGALSSQDTIRMLPSNTFLVASAEVQKLLSIPVFRKLIEGIKDLMLRRDANFGDLVSDFVRQTGVDPLHDVEKVLYVMRLEDDTVRFAVLADAVNTD